MKAAPWVRDPEFLKLQHQWNERLELEGLPEEPDSLFYVTQKVRRKAGTAEYFADAKAYLYAKRWRSIRDKTIWRLHSEGQTVRAIASFLARLGYTHCSRTIAHNVVRKVRQDFKAWRLLELRKEEEVCPHPEAS